MKIIDHAVRVQEDDNRRSHLLSGDVHGIKLCFGMKLSIIYGYTSLIVDCSEGFQQASCISKETIILFVSYTLNNLGCNVL